MGEAGPGSPQYFHVLPSRTASSSEPKKRRSPLGTGVQIETTIANFWSFEDGWPVKLAEYHDIERVQAFTAELAALTSLFHA